MRGLACQCSAIYGGTPCMAVDKTQGWGCRARLARVRTLGGSTKARRLNARVHGGDGWLEMVL